MGYSSFKQKDRLYSGSFQLVAGNAGLLDDARKNTGN